MSKNKTPTSKAVLRALNTRIGPHLDHHDLQRIAARPLQQRRWVLLRNPPVPVDDVVKTQFFSDGESAIALFAAEEKTEWPGIGEVFQRLEAHIIAAVGYMLSGKPLEKMRETVGLSEIDLRVISACDRPGFNPLWKWIKQERSAQRRRRYEDILQERVENGTDKPVVLRESKDHDIVKMVKVHSDSLLVKANEFDRADRAAAAGSTNIGTQVVYNVRLPDYLAVHKEEKMIEAEEVKDE